MSGELEGVGGALAALAESRLADLWETTLTLLERGKAEDDANNGSAAVLLYSEAVGGLQALLELEENEKRLELLRARLTEYTSRLAQLRTALLQTARTSLADEAEDLANELWGTPRDTLSLQRQASQELKITSATAASAAAAPMASARMCAELAMLADEKGDNADAIDHYTEAVEWYLMALKLEPDEKEKAAARKATGVLLQRAEELKRGPQAAPRRRRRAGRRRAGAARRRADAGAGQAAGGAAAQRAGEASARALVEDSRAAGVAVARRSAPRAVCVPGAVERPRRHAGAEQGAARPLWAVGAAVRVHARRAEDDLPGVGANDHADDHHRLLVRLVARDRRRARAPLPQAADHQHHLPAGPEGPADLQSRGEVRRQAARQRRRAEGGRRRPHPARARRPADVLALDARGGAVGHHHREGARGPSAIYCALPPRSQPPVSLATPLPSLTPPPLPQAYLKINGGYDFPGSNSGIDMFALTGWIPEQYRTDDDDFKPARLWERLCSASKYGDCLITVATGEMDEAEEKKWGLVPTHAYAVLQVREVGGVKLLQLKNPWARLRWKGAYSVHDRQRWTPALREALNYDVEAATRADNGIFWIDYGSLLKFYKGIYSNWNPALFRHHTATHGQWPKRQPNAASDEHTLAHSPQYALSVSVNAADGKGAAVWLLLTRTPCARTTARTTI